MQRRQLPIGIQSFRTLREDGCYYVDKTPLIHQLVSQGRHCFLSRPRRFGKSLLRHVAGRRGEVRERGADLRYSLKNSLPGVFHYRKTKAWFCFACEFNG